MKITHQAQHIITFTTPTANAVKFGECFRVCSAGAHIFMRVKPVSWMLNSALIQDKLAHGYIFAVNVESGNFFTVIGQCQVILLDTQLQILSKK